jgi:hypothetical protein
LATSVLLRQPQFSGYDTTRLPFLDLHLFELDLLPHTAVLTLVSSPSSTSDGTPAGGNPNANWGGGESRVARLVLELEVEAVNTSQHEDEGKRREECTH